MFAKKKLKRQDFQFENGWFETLVRRPGQLQMQQFQISDCEQCNIFLFDAAACVYIDQCKYCLIFVGACEASVFVRDCTHITVVCTTQQFRVRDCFNCHFQICCESQPIIQSSRGITITNFPLLAYPQLIQQMQQTKTTPWNNNWFDVYDFTPHKFKTQNFKLASLSHDKETEIKNKILSKMKEQGLNESPPIIPRIMGKGEFTTHQIGVIVAYPVPPPIASENYELLQSRVHYISSEQIKALSLQIQYNGRVKILFVKVLRNHLPKWKKILHNIVRQITEIPILQIYQSTVFAPFKDEH